MQEAKTLGILNINSSLPSFSSGKINELLPILTRLGTLISSFSESTACFLGIYKRLCILIDSDFSLFHESIGFQAIAILVVEEFSKASSKALKIRKAQIYNEISQNVKLMGVSLVQLAHCKESYQVGYLIEKLFRSNLKLGKCIKQAFQEFLSGYSGLSTSIIFKLIKLLELLENLIRTPLFLVLTAAQNIETEAPNVVELKNFPTLYSMYINKVMPYLPAYTSKSYTLVLDLDETLGCLWKNSFRARPGVERFLTEVSERFEVVLFTASSAGHADAALRAIDSGSRINLRLYREQTQNYIKDLRTLGRDLSRVCIVDNNPYSFSKQPQNGIQIATWKGDPDDQALISLLPFLINLANSNQDVRHYIASNL